MDTILKKLGKRIRTLRKARGLSQELLAERANIHPAFLGQIERSETFPTVKTLIRIASGLGIQPSELLSGKVSPVPIPKKELLALEISGLLRTKSIKTILLARSLVKDLLRALP